MKTVKVTIKGISPLLMHKFPHVSVDGIDKMKPHEQAELAAYRMDSGELYIPGVNIQRALVAAAGFSKGKGRASLAKEAAACLLVNEAQCGLGVKGYVLDSRPCVIAATKGRILRHRPRLDDWECTFSLSYDETLLSEAQVRRIVDDCGTRVGLLDFRPQCRGPFGRFMVTNWEMD